MRLPFDSRLSNVDLFHPSRCQPWKWPHELPRQGETWAYILKDASAFSLQKWLLPEDLEGVQKFISPLRRQQSLRARAFCRHLLSSATQLRARDLILNTPEVQFSQAGGLPIRYSWSHTKGALAVALTVGANVGIDIEMPFNRISQPFLLQFCDRDEIQWINAQSFQALGATALWCAKEAAFKALRPSTSVRLHEIPCHERLSVSWAEWLQRHPNELLRPSFVAATCLEQQRQEACSTVWRIYTDSIEPV